MKKTWIRAALIVLVMTVFLFFAFRKVNWPEAYKFGIRITLPALILVLVLVPLHMFTRAIRWKYLLIHEKRDVKLKNLLSATAIGFAVSYVGGRIGEIVRPLYLARKENVRAGFVIGTVVVERIFDIITMCALLGIFLLARPLVAPDFLIEPEAAKILNLWGLIGAAASIALLALCLVFYFFRERALGFVSRVLKPFLPVRLRDKVLTLFHEFIDGLKFFRSLGTMLIYIGLSFVVWLGIIFFYWVFFRAYGLSLPYVLLIPYIFITGVGASIPTPGMVGGFHYFSILGLTTLFGIEANQAAGLTIVVHALQLVVTCLLGYAILWKEGLSVFQLRKLGETTKP